MDLFDGFTENLVEKLPTEQQWALGLLDLDHVIENLKKRKEGVEPGRQVQYEFFIDQIPEKIKMILDGKERLSMDVDYPKEEDDFSPSPHVRLTWIKPLLGVHVVVTDTKEGLYY